MKVIGFKDAIVATVIISFILFSVILFFISGNIYLGLIKKNLLETNIYSTEIIKDLLDEELFFISEKARETKNNRRVGEAFFDKTYTRNNGSKIKINKILLIKIGSYLYDNHLKHHTLNSYLYLEVFDENLKPILHINNFDRKNSDTGNEAYLKYILGSENSSISKGSRTFGAYVLKNNDLLIKGFSRIHFQKLYGLVAITEPVNKRYLNKLKKITGKNVILIKDNEIINSTFQGNPYNFKINKTEKIAHLKYKNDTYFFNLIELKDYKQNTLVYIGTGYNESHIYKIYKKKSKKIIPIFGLLFFILIFSILYILKKLFTPFDHILKGIKKIEKGDYHYKIKSFQEKELNLLSTSINKMAANIRDREYSLKEESDASYAKTLLLANIGHELKTPLNSILGFSEILRENTKEKESLLNIKIIEKSAYRLLRFLQDLLELTKIEAGSFEVKKESFDLLELLEEIQNNSIIQVDKKSLTFNIESNKLHKKIIYSDKQKLFQIITNLIQNSIKYTETGSILLEVKDRKNYLLLDIFDSGIGIPSEKIENIFSPFTQINHYAEGAGLGLSIVKKFIDILDGEIKITSKVNFGTHCEIKIPIEKSIKAFKENLKLRVQPEILPVLDLYINNFSERLNYLKADIRNKDLDSITQKVHELKGVSLMLSIHEVSSICKNIEDIILCDDIDYNLIDKYFNELTLINKNLDSKQKTNILVGEDNPENQELLKINLKKMGLYADFFKNGLEVIEALEKKEYNLLIMDINMPVLDGKDSIQIIKNKYPNLFSIAITALRGTNDELLTLGFSDVLEKPFTFLSLKNKIHKSRGDF